jgi:hypothetical protein
MPIVVAGLLLLVVAFAICDWSGRTLAQHYQDRLEVVAILAVGACVLVSLVLTRGVRENATGWVEFALLLTMAGGLFAGYFRAGRLG